MQTMQRRPGMPTATLTARTLLALCWLLPAVCEAAAPQPPCATVDHGALTTLLEQHVTVEGVDYLRLAGSPKLKAYLQALEGTCARSFEAQSSADRLAFWINGYNAAVLSLVARHAPVPSIQAIGASPGDGFTLPVLRAGHLVGRPGATLSLDEIETVIRGFGDPRIHFALVCAARSCPELQPRAYLGARLDSQLEEATARFLRDPTKNDLRVRDGAVAVSKIFEWYRADFGSSPEDLWLWLARRTSGLKSDGGVPQIRFLDYDWTLNGR